MHANQFKDELSSEILSLSSLKRLLLKNNEFNGLIPSDICSFSTITEYSFSDNDFCPEYPVCDDIAVEVGEQGCVLGCMDESACNHDLSATQDDGSCILNIDCMGVCGGLADDDDCGVCSEGLTGHPSNID